MPMTSNDSKKLTLVPYVFIIYALTCPGPFNVEVLVGAAGPFLAIAGFQVFLLLYNIPGVLITTELGCAFPENGGFIVWIYKAFGPFWAFILGFWKFATNIRYMAAFMVLFADFFYQDIFPSLNILPHLIIAALSIFLLSFLNFTSLVNTGYRVMGLCIFVILPFAILCLVAIPRIEPRRWISGGDENVQKDWKSYFTAYFYVLGYWDDASTLVGEVDEAPQTFFKAMWIATLLRFLSYSLPLIATIGALPLNQELWTGGYYGDAAEVIAGTWLQNWIRLARVLVYYAIFQARLCCLAYQIEGMASLGIVPKILGVRWSWSNVPVMGYAITILVTFFGYYMGVKIVDPSLFVTPVLTIVMEMASFLWLRRKMPDLDRPHKVPMAIAMPWLVIMCLVSITYSICITAWNVGLTSCISGISLTLPGILLYYLMQYFKSQNWLEFNEKKDS